MSLTYQTQLVLMNARFLQWRADNPTERALIVWNFPREAGVIGTITDAIKYGIVEVNEPARKLIEFMCDTGESEPTVMMVRAVLET